MKKNDKLQKMMVVQAAAVVLLYTLLSCFMTAGALGVLHHGDGAFSLGGFLRGAARNGFRFVRLLALFLAVCWVLSWLAGFQLGERCETWGNLMYQIKDFLKSG